MRKTRIRRKSRVFRRRHVGRTIVKIFLWLLVIPVAIGGYYLAQYLFTREPASPVDAPPAAVDATGTADVTDSADAPQPTTAESPDIATDRAALSSLRAIYLPQTALRSLDGWSDTLSAAQAAGYNAVIFDVKDADGNLWVQSQTELAVAAQSACADALTMDELRAAAEKLSTYHLTAVPRLYAFRDDVAPRRLESARVMLASNHSQCWFDGKPGAGGRRWLNPCSADARRYITELAAELRGAGFSLLMLDGVQFPDQESQAYYGDDTPRVKVMAAFAQEMNDAVGAENWLLTATATAMAGEGEKLTVYGGNPVTFGAPAVSPWALPSAMGAQLKLGSERVSAPAAHPYEALTLLFHQLQARLNLMETPAPVVVPWLQADGYTAEQVASEVRAYTDCFGEGAPYILYSASGKYTF